MKALVYCVGISLLLLLSMCARRIFNGPQMQTALRSAQSANVLQQFEIDRLEDQLILRLLDRLKKAYPEHIKDVSLRGVIWMDDSQMPLHEEAVTLAQDAWRRLPPSLAGAKRRHLWREGTILENPTLYDQLALVYPTEMINKHYIPHEDPGRVRYEPFFKKMYGGSRAEVEKNLVYVDWLPHIFGRGTFKVRVTKINGVSQKVESLSQELEQLVLRHPEYKEFLEDPAGSYYWRKIAHTDRLSPHCFGIAIDLNCRRAHYWQWDLKRENKKVTEDAPLTYKNEIPLSIVQLFQKYGFIWGGAWYHYDTMHFEYRPELL